MLEKVDKRIAEIVKKQAKDKLDLVLIEAEDLMKTGKDCGRALADALEKYRID